MPDLRPFPYHPIGFKVEVVVGVVGPLFTEDAGDSLLESSSFPSFRDLEHFFFFLCFDRPSCFELFLFSLDSRRFFEDSSVVIIVMGFTSLISSSPLSSSNVDSELDDDDEEDDSDDDEVEDELEFDELEDESDDPDRDFFLLCFLLRRFRGFGFLFGSQQSQ